MYTKAGMMSSCSARNSCRRSYAA